MSITLILFFIVAINSLLFFFNTKRFTAHFIGMMSNHYLRPLLNWWAERRVIFSSEIQLALYCNKYSRLLLQTVEASFRIIRCWFSRNRKKLTNISGISSMLFYFIFKRLEFRSKIKNKWVFLFDCFSR